MPAVRPRDRRSSVPQAEGPQQGVDLPLEDTIEAGAGNPLSQPIERTKVNGKTIGNRIAIHPMEGWDGTTTGGISEEMKRRWERFGASGAKLICGAEAMAVRADGRANMNQLIINEENQAGITELVSILKAEHLARWGSVDDLVIGFQLTHSGRFCKPNEKTRVEPRVAYRHPLDHTLLQGAYPNHRWADADGLSAHLAEEAETPAGFALSYQATRELQYDGDVPAGFGAQP